MATESMHHLRLQNSEMVYKMDELANKYLFKFFLRMMETWSILEWDDLMTNFSCD